MTVRQTKHATVRYAPGNGSFLIKYGSEDASIADVC